MSLQTMRWVLAAPLLAILSVPAATASEPEDELKSAIVLSFLRYSDWPEPAPAGQPLTVGVIGRPSLLPVLRRVLEGKLVNNRPVRILAVKDLSDPHCCQVIYLATGKSDEIQQTLASARLAHSLTIGEAGRFLEYGGAVNLILVDGRMTFEVNLDALGRSGVAISSKLLRYGQVKGRPRT
jgi:YfiR/HmsC-like